MPPAMSPWGDFYKSAPITVPSVSHKFNLTAKTGIESVNEAKEKLNGKLDSANWPYGLAYVYSKSRNQWYAVFHNDFHRWHVSDADWIPPFSRSGRWDRDVEPDRDGESAAYAYRRESSAYLTGRSRSNLGNRKTPAPSEASFRRPAASSSAYAYRRESSAYLNGRSDGGNRQTPAPSEASRRTRASANVNPRGEAPDGS